MLALTLWAEQPVCLWDETLPIEVKEFPEDLAALDRLLSDPELSMVVLERWRREVVNRSLGADVLDLIHLRRFCRIALCERAADESTVRKLTRRIGAETVKQPARALIVDATRPKRFRPLAVSRANARPKRFEVRGA